MERLRTKAIIGTQAITGYWRAEDWPDVLRLSPIVLAQIDPNNEYHQSHINEMLNGAQNEIPVDPLSWARFPRSSK